MLFRSTFPQGVTIRIEEREVRVRRWRNLHFRETPRTLLDVVRVDDPAYKRPLLIGTTARELTTDELGELRNAVLQHKVVFLRNQPYVTEHLERLTLQLGGHGHTPFLEIMPGHPGVVKVVKEADEGGLNFGGQWHSDWSFQPEPPAFTLLWSLEVPPHGGDTMWSNQELAFDTLSDGLKQTLLDLEVVHSAGWAYAADGILARTASGRTMKINTSDTDRKSTRLNSSHRT